LQHTGKAEISPIVVQESLFFIPELLFQPSEAKYELFYNRLDENFI
jgi:hypothetical protein